MVPRHLPGKPFPPYKYLPGRTPHPRKHPDGPSCVIEECAGPPLAEANWGINEVYLYGIDLYNHGYWWEAHEAWERLWALAAKESLEQVFLQGLIQTAAALLKARAGNARGAGKLWGKARPKLERVCAAAPSYMGLALADFVYSTTQYIVSGSGHSRIYVSVKQKN